MKVRNYTILVNKYAKEKGIVCKCIADKTLLYCRYIIDQLDLNEQNKKLLHEMSEYFCKFIRGSYDDFRPLLTEKNRIPNLDYFDFNELTPYRSGLTESPQSLARWIVYIVSVLGSSIIGYYNCPSEETIANTLTLYGIGNRRPYWKLRLIVDHSNLNTELNEIVKKYEN